MAEFGKKVHIDLDVANRTWYLPGLAPADTSVQLITLESDIPLEREDIDVYINALINRIDRGTLVLSKTTGKGNDHG